MCTTVYIGALSALAEIGRALGEDEKTIDRYQEIAARGATLMDAELFNGDYYAQRVQWEGLRDTSLADQVGAIDPATADEMSLLLLQEGPKYQYGPGCLSDGVIGAWMATLYGVDTPLRREGIRAHLAAIFRHNFRSDLWEHACTQRPGYANGHEAGLLLCTWPNDGKPVLPFVYSDEVWTGIEYQVATHLILEGMVSEGLALVEAVRSRFDGRVRNPFNEYECGNYYARAMASFALLPALSGFRYSAVTRTLEFGSAARVAGEAFVVFFSTASGYGLIRQDAQVLTVEMTEGELVIEHLLLRGGSGIEEIAVKKWQATACVGSPVRCDIAS